MEKKGRIFENNPAGDLPVITDKDGVNIIGYECLIEYLDEKKIGKNLLGDSPIDRLEVRRLCMWIGKKL